jgi:hypothetical protein
MSRTEWEAVLTTPARAHAWNSSSGGGRSGRNVRDLRDRLGPPRLARYGCAHPWARLDTARPRPQNDGNQGRRQAFCSCQGCGPSARRFARPTEERMVTVIDQTDRVSADHHAPGHLRRVDVAAEEVRARVERGDAVRARCGAWEDLPDEQPRRRGAVGVDGHIVRGVHIAVRELNREGPSPTAAPACHGRRRSLCSDHQGLRWLLFGAFLVGARATSDDPQPPSHQRYARNEAEERDEICITNPWPRGDECGNRQHGCANKESDDWRCRLRHAEEDAGDREAQEGRHTQTLPAEP